MRSASYFLLGITVLYALVHAGQGAVAAPAPIQTSTQAARAASPQAEKITFASDMLLFPVDVDMFAEGNPVAPGEYRVDLYLNQDWKGLHTLRLDVQNPQDRVAQPCFDQKLLNFLGIDSQYIRSEWIARLQSAHAICGDLGQIIEGASSQYHAGTQRLDVAAPQAVLLRQARGYVDPTLWDAGIHAATLAYQYNAWHQRQEGFNQSSQYMGLRAGINFGHWRMRYSAALSHSPKVGVQYRGNDLYVERAVSAWKSQLTLGDTTTDGRIINGVQLRGITLRSDERMYPDSANGFAPVIRGVANSNARVTVTQGGLTIYEITVPQGPFVIDDLYPNGSGGDLFITITEADGRAHSFTVTYAALPEMLRPGATRYSAAIGHYHNRYSRHKPKLLTGTLSHGINNTVTSYGASMLAQSYRALSLGLGLNLPVGAVTFDTTYARTVIAKQQFSGLALRLAYSKRFMRSDTDVTLALARYATQDYLEPTQAFERIAQAKPLAETMMQRRSQLSLHLNQTLPATLGTLSLSGSLQNYWQYRAHDLQYHLGYGRSFGLLGTSVAVTRSRNMFSGQWDNQYFLNFSLPLGSTKHHSHLNSSYAWREGSQTAQVSLGGNASDDINPITYNLYGSASRSAGQKTGNGGASFAWIAPLARVGASVSSGSRGNRQVSVSASGGLLAFHDGVLLSPELGQTVGIVQAQSAAGVKVSGTSNTQLNAQGYAVVPYLHAYRENTIALDPTGTSTDIELISSSQKVAPTAGAVVLLQYKTHRAYALLVTGSRSDASLLPFAASVLDESGKNVGYVGQGGQALVRVDHIQGILSVRWGSQAKQQCHFDYDLGDISANLAPPTGGLTALRRLEVICI